VVLCYIFVMLLFFFFQAEDGIRDRNVTGVQTCAIPIMARWASSGRSFQKSVPSVLRFGKDKFLSMAWSSIWSIHSFRDCLSAIASIGASLRYYFRKYTLKKAVYIIVATDW